MRKRVILLLLLVAALAAVAASDPVHDAVTRVLAWATGIIETHPLTGAAVFVVLSALSAMLAFFSTAVFVPVAAYAFGPLTTVILLWTGWLLGGVTSYGIGATLGRRVAKWLVSVERFAYYSDKITHDTGFLTILLFQLALPSEVPGYVLGAMKYRFRLYFAALALAELPFAIGAVYLGRSFIQREYVVLLAIGVAGVILSALAFRQLHRRFALSSRA